LLRLAQGMGFGRLLAATRGVREPEDAFAGVEFSSLETVLRESDFVTINCPLNETTRGMIGAPQLALMKPTAYLINTARGAIVDEVALAAALREQRIAGAGIDVFGTEPVPVVHPFLQLDNVILSPHSVARTGECTSQAGLSCCRSVLAVFQGKAPPYIANPEVLSRPGTQKKLDAFRESRGSRAER
jgi:phosphoglycerate dehydrogenase-like enzyme